jgi:uncharacterized membrane protein
MKKDHPRFIYIDLLRGWALIIMIEVHVFNAFLLPSLKETGWFNFLNFINGLVAPAFLFVSGFAFIISTERRIDDIRKLRGYFWKKLSRIGLIFLAGYSLHLPFFSFTKIISAPTYNHLITWFNVDILQCISSGLLFLLLLRIIIKNERLFYSLLIWLSILISLISPVIWKIDFSEYIPLFFADYLNPLNGSYFPVFPWLFFLLSGAFYSRYYIGARNENRENNFIIKIFLYSLIPISLGHLFFSGLFVSPLFSIRPNPLFLYQRLGYVLMLSSFFWYYANKRQTKKSYVLDVSRESLLIYWLHLEVIYSKIWSGKSLVEIIGGSFSAVESLAATLTLLILMIFAGNFWGAIKKKYPAYIRPTVSILIIISIVIFLIR